MKILRLKIENYRGVTCREVTFQPCGVTVVEGDNEVGKTSMAEAIDLLFDFLDSSKDRRVVQIKPVGRDVGSLIEIDVQTGRYEFTYRKQFNRRSFTELRVVSPKVEQLSGREAHDRVDEILHETMDVALWKALRLQQGVKLDQADLSSQTSLQDALDAGSAAALGGEREGNLFDRVTSEYQSYWSLRTGKALARALELSKRQADADAEVSRWEAELAALSATVEHCARLKQDVNGAAAELDLCLSDLTVLRGRSQAMQEEAQRVAALASRVEAAKAEATAASVTLKARDLLISRQAAVRAELSQADTDVAREVPTLELRKDLLEKCIAAAASADASRSSAQNAWVVATRDLEHLRDLESVAGAGGQLSRYSDATLRIADAKAAIDNVNVTKTALGKIEDAHLLWRQTMARCQRELPTVTLTGEGQVVRLNDENVLLGREPQVLPIADNVRLQLGSVQVEVAAGGNAEALAHAEADARNDYEQICSRCAVQDVEEARSVFSQRESAKARLQHAHAQQSDALAGGSLAELEEKLSSAQARIAAYEVARASEAPLPASIESARQELDGLRRDLAAAEATQKRARTDVEQAREHQDRARDAAIGAQRAYVGPLREKIESLGRLVFGPTLGIDLTDDLRIDSRTLNGQRLDFANLSGGAREQLSVISRLACACLVSPFGGVPVIFDDALGYSDPGRLAAMGAVLALAGRTCQVLVLTCMPARYRAVGGAAVVDFGSAIASTALIA